MKQVAKVIGLIMAGITILGAILGTLWTILVFTVSWQVSEQLKELDYVSSAELQATEEVLVTRLDGIETQVKSNAELNQTILSAVLD